MTRALLALSILVCSATTLEAQRLDPNAALKNYAAKVLPRCPGGVLTLAPGAIGPANFESYVVTLKSSDKYCGTQRSLLYSPKSKQVLVGSVIPLPEDGRPTATRIGDQASRLLGQKLSALVAPFPLPDGIRSVSIDRLTPYGKFSYSGFVDQSEKYLIVGFRGSLNTDPAKSFREALGISKQARRGTPTAKAEILEISDFECPTCAKAHEKLEPLIRKNLGKLNYVRIDMPLFEMHEWSVPAAMGARAIQRVAPARYWEYVDHVFRNQEQIGKRKFDDVFKEYAEDHDLDWAALKKIYASPAERQALLDQVSRAYSIGIASTPTFIVNGQIMGFGPEGTFTIDAIRSAIGMAPGTPAAQKPAK